MILIIFIILILLVFSVSAAIVLIRNFSAKNCLISLLPSYIFLILLAFLDMPMCDCFQSRYGIIVAIILALLFMGIFYGIAKYYEKKGEQPKKLIIFLTFISLIAYVIIFRSVIDIGDKLFPVFGEF
ncbi:MAG TPA: hypothetical protein P5232_04625 [Candidatus Moranbacteria bacterium]|nr:hypothetical protein [Candidatus Moranbacteria bacterium]